MKSHCAPIDVLGDQTMDFLTLIQRIVDRPDMYFRAHFYDCFEAFIQGLDAASGQKVTAGFREWLLAEARAGGVDGSGMGWPRLVLRLDCPECAASPEVWPTTLQEHQSAMEKAVKRLTDFHSSKK